MAERVGKNYQRTEEEREKKADEDWHFGEGIEHDRDIG